MNELKEIPIEELRKELHARRKAAWIMLRAVIVLLVALLTVFFILAITEPYEAVAETQTAAGEGVSAAEKQRIPEAVPEETEPETAGTQSAEEETISAAEKQQASGAGDVREYLGTFTLTAYCSCRQCCGRWSGGPTASGTMPEAGRTIAVDKRVIPLGTRVYIEGYGEFVAEDTGSAVRGNHIDIYMDSHEAARWFADGAGSCRKEVWIMHK